MRQQEPGRETRCALLYTLYCKCLACLHAEWKRALAWVTLYVCALPSLGASHTKWPLLSEPMMSQRKAREFSLGHFLHTWIHTTGFVNTQKAIEYLSTYVHLSESESCSTAGELCPIEPAWQHSASVAGPKIKQACKRSGTVSQHECFIRCSDVLSVWNSR